MNSLLPKYDASDFVTVKTKKHLPGQHNQQTHRPIMLGNMPQEIANVLARGDDVDELKQRAARLDALSSIAAERRNAELANATIEELLAARYRSLTEWMTEEELVEYFSLGGIE